MRKHGWQLPYHPLQVVAVAVFLALGFAFYVFFAPFIGKKMYQYIIMGIYTPLIICSFGLYIWCAAADPADSGVFKSKKYLKVPDNKKNTQLEGSKQSTSSIHDAHATTTREKTPDKGTKDTCTRTEDGTTEIGNKNASPPHSSCFTSLLAFLPCAFICNCSSRHEESTELQTSEDGMFYCSLCEVEVYKYSKHCRVCDKCVDSFDHHCRWLNNCIGKKNYPQFFALMVSALLLLVLQWSTGILVLICCFLERKRFSVDITSKLGSSFSVVPFVIVVSVCTILAMIATLPIAQLFFFHILLVKKGISTYDYIIALREQEQGVGGQQSQQMSPASSLTGLSSASSFNTFHRAAWCTPPRLFIEDQFDVVPPDTGSVSSLGKKTVQDEPIKKKNPAAVKISPWALARLNAEEVSKVAAEARKKSKILQPVVRPKAPPFGAESYSTFGNSGHQTGSKADNNNRRRASKRIRLPADIPLEKVTPETLSLAPLQLEARSAFRTNLGMSSSPESSLDSPDLHPFRVSSSGDEEARRLAGPSSAGAKADALKGIPFSRSTSDGYEASGGEDSDQVPSRIAQRSMNWSSLLFGADRDERVVRLMPSASSSSQANNRKL